MRLTAKTHKVKGIKGHEELHAHVDEKGAGTVWVRLLQVDEKGKAEQGLQIPLASADARQFAAHLNELADYAVAGK